MDKTQIQKLFRKILIIATCALFVTLVIPAYIQYKTKNSTIPKCIMMWTVVFGTASNNQINNNFDFSWIGFIPFVLAFIMLMIALCRKFIVIDSTNVKEHQAVEGILDVINLVFSISCLILFIALPISLSNGSGSLVGLWLKTIYSWGFSVILCYIICAVMIFSSIMVLSANTVAKFIKLKKMKNSSNE